MCTTSPENFATSHYHLQWWCTGNHLSTQNTYERGREIYRGDWDTKYTITWKEFLVEMHTDFGTTRFGNNMLWEQRAFGNAGFWERGLLGTRAFGNAGFWKRGILGNAGFLERVIFGTRDFGNVGFWEGALRERGILGTLDFVNVGFWERGVLGTRDFGNNGC